MDSRDKRDLPEVVAEILIEQHAMREEIVALRQDIRQSSRELREEIQQSNRELREEIKAGNDEMVAVFNNMTNAILDAINRGTDRYNGAAAEIDGLKVRVTKLENPAA